MIPSWSRPAGYLEKNDGFSPEISFGVPRILKLARTVAEWLSKSLSKAQLSYRTRGIKQLWVDKDQGGKAICRRDV